MGIRGYTKEIIEMMNKIENCELCGRHKTEIKKPYGFPKPLQTHHKTPVSQGGTNDRYNLIRVCGKCHIALHKIEKYNKERKAMGESK